MTYSTIQHRNDKIIGILSTVVENLQGQGGGVEEVNHTFKAYVAQQLDDMLQKEKKRKK